MLVQKVNSWETNHKEAYLIDGSRYLDHMRLFEVQTSPSTSLWSGFPEDEPVSKATTKIGIERSTDRAYMKAMNRDSAEFGTRGRLQERRNSGSQSKSTAQPLRLRERSARRSRSPSSASVSVRESRKSLTPPRTPPRPHNAPPRSISPEVSDVGDHNGLMTGHEIWDGEKWVNTLEKATLADASVPALEV